MVRASLLLVLACCSPAVLHATQSAGNPIRKVVTMLQDMEAKVKAEGKKQEAAYEAFMCYCKTGVSDLEASISAAEAKIESLTADIKGDLEKLKQTKENSKKHMTSRDDAKAAMQEATELRKKENTAFNQFKSDQETNIDAVQAATSAVEKGMGGSFLQTSAANVVRKFAMERAEMSDDSRSELLAFLAGSHSQGYAPASGEIVGILKQMGDTMNKDLADATAAEKTAIQDYEGLMSAKTKEVETLQKQIEGELKLIGELEMATADMTNDLEETEDSLAADKKFLKELEKGCATKTGEWEVICKTRAEELLAIAETIKVLNDDDALELFKKTLPGASASLLQVQVSAKSMRARALEILRSVPRSSQLDLVQMLLSITPGSTHKDTVAAKNSNFATVIKMIDDMTVNLKKEQVADETKKEYCEVELDKTEDKNKVLENSLSDSNTAIEDMDGALATLADEMAALKAGIKALDKSVAGDRHAEGGSCRVRGIDCQRHCCEGDLEMGQESAQ
jgi:chromosome segregation ATPase